ncbi:hypothetical protein GGX14DRAFT_390441 [Mycena pura]|uniref:Uncharacterized protein n=1 Tax=Mycena pura TaxID=153505 RepID=A0AAD6YK93_9AGAR|nr:hypothetical protein GGX14DRAFT_390441 [Mycena pura]
MWTRKSRFAERGVTKAVGLGLAQSHFDGAESHSPACQWDSGLMVDIKVGFGFACSYWHQLCEDHDQLCWSPPPVLWWQAERSGRQVQQAVGAVGELGSGNGGERSSDADLEVLRYMCTIQAGRSRTGGCLRRQSIGQRNAHANVCSAECGVQHAACCEGGSVCNRMIASGVLWMLRCLLKIEYKAMPVEILQCHGYNLNITIEIISPSR